MLHLTSLVHELKFMLVRIGTVCVIKSKDIYLRVARHTHAHKFYGPVLSRTLVHLGAPD